MLILLAEIAPSRRVLIILCFSENRVILTVVAVALFYSIQVKGGEELYQSLQMTSQ